MKIRSKLVELMLDQEVSEVHTVEKNYFVRWCQSTEIGRRTVIGPNRTHNRSITIQFSNAIQSQLNGESWVKFDLVRCIHRLSWSNFNQMQSTNHSKIWLIFDCTRKSNFNWTVLSIAIDCFDFRFRSIAIVWV